MTKSQSVRNKIGSHNYLPMNSCLLYMHVNDWVHSKFNLPKNVLNILNKDIFMIS